jgi:hypothetical protein
MSLPACKRFSSEKVKTHSKWEGTGRTQHKQQKLKFEQEDANHSMPLPICKKKKKMHWRQGGGVCVEMPATACLHANTFPQCS